MTNSDAPIVFFLMSISVVVGFMIGFFASLSNIQKEAVAKGHAEYVIKYDTAVWQWKELNPTPTK